LLGPEGHDDFRNAVVDALWQQQRDIADPSVLAECLTRADRSPDLAKRALTPEARTQLADETRRANAGGIFSVPTFVCNNEVFFGNDRLDRLGWCLGQETTRT
jgi:2-hydroxychromene-2-carboxylate isomerase